MFSSDSHFITESRLAAFFRWLSYNLE